MLVGQIFPVGDVFDSLIENFESFLLIVPLHLDSK